MLIFVVFAIVLALVNIGNIKLGPDDSGQNIVTHLGLLCYLEQAWVLDLSFGGS